MTCFQRHSGIKNVRLYHAALVSVRVIKWKLGSTSRQYYVHICGRSLMFVTRVYIPCLVYFSTTVALQVGTGRGYLMRGNGLNEYIFHI